LFLFLLDYRGASFPRDIHNILRITSSVFYEYFQKNVGGWGLGILTAILINIFKDLACFIIETGIGSYSPKKIYFAKSFAWFSFEGGISSLVSQQCR
jgi:hypothetical protein